MNAFTRKRLTALLALAVLLLSPLCLTSCGGGEPGEDFIETEYAGSTLYVYNWGEYISDGSEGSLDVVAEFERRYGIEVRYDYFSTNEELYAQLSSGAKYDVVIPSDYMIERMVKENMLAELDFSNIPNYHYIGEGYKSKYYDPENKYSVPYSVGMVGIIYNTEKVGADIVDKTKPETLTWDLLWRDDFAAADKISMNNPRDAFGVSMISLGLSVNTTDPADWERAYRKLREQDCIYLMDEIYNKMENNTSAMAAYYAGDCISMMQSNDKLDFFYPTEGTNIFVDAMCIPENAPNKGAAELFINFMLDPDIATANANYICYASPNTAVVTHPDYDYAVGTEYYDILYTLPESYATDPDKMQYYHFLDDGTQKLLNDYWARLGVAEEEGGNYAGTYVFLTITCLILVGGSGYFIWDAIHRAKQAKARKMKKR